MSAMGTGAVEGDTRAVCPPSQKPTDGREREQYAFKETGRSQAGCVSSITGPTTQKVSTGRQAAGIK